ncbi:MAG TPA: amino acid permease [Thermoanaerobaculia bacterium]|nr:amino acid permease [Thermoanaerobaculia bacterium]
MGFLEEGTRRAAGGAAPPDAAPPEEPGLVRGLGAWDATLLTIGSIVGTGVFLTTGDMAKVLPSPGLILLVWAAGGLLTLAGALSYAELGTLFPRAGGLYHFLKEAYGPLWGFLYGWAAFLVIMSGGIAALGVAFGEYLGSFLPFFSTRHVLASLPVGGWTWTLSGGQLAAVGAILVLTAINHFGLKEGAWVQNALTVLKVGSIGAFAALGLLAPAPAGMSGMSGSAAAGAAGGTVAAGGAAGAGGGTVGALAQASSGALLAAFGVAMIAALWTYDGWYGATCSAGEIRNPGRNLPRGLIWGTATVTVLYVLLNLVYVRALPVAAMAATPRIGEAAAAALFGPGGARLVSLAVLVSTFGCLSSTILYSSRIYLPMAQDGLFFRSLARIHPRHRTPVASLWAQTAWSVLLTLSGTYEQLYTYVVFAAVLFHAAIGSAIFVLRRRRPELPRPYRAWGYPVVPALFVLACLLLIGNTLVEKPVESLLGLGLVALGLPAFAWLRRKSRGPSPV